MKLEPFSGNEFTRIKDGIICIMGQSGDNIPYLPRAYIANHVF